MGSDKSYAVFHDKNLFHFEIHSYIQLQSNIICMIRYSEAIVSFTTVPTVWYVVQRHIISPIRSQ